MVCLLLFTLILCVILGVNQDRIKVHFSQYENSSSIAEATEVIETEEETEAATTEASETVEATEADAPVPEETEEIVPENTVMEETVPVETIPEETVMEETVPVETEAERSEKHAAMGEENALASAK